MFDNDTERIETKGILRSSIVANLPSFIVETTMCTPFSVCRGISAVHDIFESTYHYQETRTEFTGTAKLGNKDLDSRAEMHRLRGCFESAIVHFEENGTHLTTPLHPSAARPGRFVRPRPGSLP